MTRGTSQLSRDYRFVFGSPEGQRVLSDLFRACHVLAPIFTTDPLQLAHREGMRNVALRIASQLHYAPQDFMTLADNAMAAAQFPERHDDDTDDHA